ncbi:MAG: site-2 protease family protein [Chloroflexota bacterium]
MGTSITLFRLFDIDVRVHWSFILILAYGAFAFGNGASNQILSILFGILTIVLLFVCVTLHEFGHALVAQRYDVKVPHITLLPIGGVASLERIPDKPSEEFFIAIAGPLVNIAIAIVLLPIIVLVSYSTGIDYSFSFNGLLTQMREPSLFGLLVYLFGTNLLLAVFNLLPAFPMDGGRILRALLAMVLPYVQATNIAVIIGRAMAVLLFLWGIVSGNILMFLIAFFVYVGGGTERRAVASRAVLGGIMAQDALTPSAVNLYTSEPLSRAVDLIMTSYQTDYPVIDLSGEFVGVLTRSQLISSLQNAGEDVRIVDVMIPAAQIPNCAGSTNLADVWEKMANSGSRVVAIRQNRQFAGLISTDDISEVFQVMGAAQRRKERKPEANTV